MRLITFITNSRNSITVVVSIQDLFDLCWFLQNSSNVVEFSVYDQHIKTHYRDEGFGFMEKWK